MKAQKTNLIKEGFDVNLFDDRIFYFDVKIKRYTELTKDIYDQILNGKIRF